MPPHGSPSNESAFAPDVPLIDAHHHFWGEGHFGAARFGVFLPEDFVSTVESSGHRLAATVYVDCGWAFRSDGPEHLRCVGETNYAETTARQFRSAQTAAGQLCAGIVGQADLMLGEAVAEILEAHIAAAPERFRGVREWVAHDRDAYQSLGIPPGKALDSRFQAGFSRLASLGLSCDLLCTHPMLEDIVHLARAFPDTAIILNHLAGPIGVGRFSGQRDAVFADWRGKLRMLASHPNVSLKLSGMGADVMNLGWQKAARRPDSLAVATAISPYVEAAIEAFSPWRCMFGSNFPVDRQSFDYDVMWNAFKRIAARYSADEQAALLAGTARRIYRLAI